MAVENGTLQLSEEAQREIAAARAEAKEAREENKKLQAQMATLLSSHTTSQADTFVAELKGMGFSEERGFSGMLAEVRLVMSEDDGGPAVQSDKFADDGNADGTLTLSDVLRRVFRAIERGEDGQIKLGQQVVQPAATANGGEGGETKLGDDGKPLPEKPEEKSFDELSEEEALADLAKDTPGLLDVMHLAVPGASSNGSKKDGD